MKTTKAPRPSRPPRPDLLPAQLRGGVGQPKASTRATPGPAGARPPRPDLLPARLRGGVGQPKASARPIAQVRSSGGAAPRQIPSKRALTAQRRAGTRGASAVQMARALPAASDAKVRAPVPALHAAVSDYDQKMAFIAHWIWWDEGVCKVQAIAAEADAAGLESSSANHPDQTFWAQKLKARPNKTAAIVTDCKLLPCWKKNYQGCAHALPGIIKSVLGAGIPIACFAHAEGLGQRQVFYTESGASRAEIDEALSNVYTWEWDSDYDPESY